MAKKKIKITRRKKPVQDFAVINKKDEQFVKDIIANDSLMRSTLLRKLIDPRRDIDDQCGYPKSVTVEQYKIMYDREGIATRVTSIFPQESWSEDPVVEENDDTNPTEFEEAWENLERKLQLFSYMMRIDELSGIGRYGILLLGFDDGKELDQSIEGINERGEKVGKMEHQLLFLRAFDESSINIKNTEKDILNPRFGKPVMYSIKFEDFTNKDRDSEEGAVSYSTSQEKKVHWTRVIHIADNRKSSEIYGVPRMQTLFNRLCDLRKITGGSAEMFWKGGFPGYAFEMDPNAKELTTVEKTALRKTVDEYANGLQRYIRLQGVHVNSLDVQVADPKAHVEVQLEMIAIVLGVPKRIFMGAEQAKLASTQDQKSWNKRLSRRQRKYITPYIIRPLIDRLIALGILPEPEKYDIKWPDLNIPSDIDKAEVMKTVSEALSKYVDGNVDMFIPPEIFMKLYMGFDANQIKEIMEQTEERQEEFDDEQEELRKAADKEEADLKKKEEKDLKKEKTK